MDKIGLKLFKHLDYDEFEPLQYWLDYDFEYDNLIEAVDNGEVIELDLEDDEDREEDIKMLQTFLERFKQEEIAFELFIISNNLEQIELSKIT